MNSWNQTRYNILGYGTLAFLVLGVGGWANFTEIRGAVIASGTVEVQNKRQVVQHPTGGVVGSINVRDGDVVQADQLLLRLDDSFDRSELEVIEGQLYSLMGIRARIQAEQSGSDYIAFDPELLERATSSPEIKNIIEGQKQLLAARRLSREQQVAQLEERKVQALNQIEELEARGRAREEQLAFITLDVADKQTLLAQGLTNKGQLLALQRDMAQISGNISETRAQVAQSRANIAEIEFAILGIESQMREQSITSMPETEAKIAELRERRNAKLETLGRMDIRAPVAGTVFDLQVHALRSVIKPAEPILHVVPNNVHLVITAVVSPHQIDQVFVGQAVSIRMTNFDTRETPQLQGKVTVVSADAQRDETSGATFYSVQIVPDDGELELLGTKEVIPGMQVEAFIQSGERTPMQYLVKPLADYFEKAMRER